MKFLILLLLFLSHTAILFGQSTVSYTVDDSNFANPERGFYHSTETHSANYSNLDINTLENYRNNGIALILREFYLEDFTESAISNAYLENMRLDFQKARQAGIKVIVRFAYTQKETTPYGDASLENVLVHLAQLKPIFAENADVIAFVQAGFIGAYGEWYYTDYFSTTLGSPNADDWVKRRQLVDALLDAVPSNLMVQVRTPNIKTSLLEDDVALTEAEAFSGSKKARLAHHNDCFVASADDVGTYVNIEQEKAYLEEETNYLVMGGETCGVAPPYSECSNAIAELERFHWSYLNIDYHPQVLQNWEDDGCFNEVQLNLGYRYRLLDATASTVGNLGSEYSITINIENDGWANVYNQRDVEIVLRNQSSLKEYYFKTNEDPRKWSLVNPTTISLTLGIPQNIEEGNYSVFVNMPDSNTSLYGNSNYSIRMANTGIWQPDLGYNDLGISLNIAASNTVNAYTGSNHFIQRSSSISAVSTEIRIDGDPSEWEQLPLSTSLGTNTVAQSLKIYNNGDSLYMAVFGNNLYDDYQLFIDLDKSATTGYSAWQWAANGADLLIENGILYSYNGVGNAWGWASVGNLNSVKNDSTIELSIALSELGNILTFNYAFVNDPNNTVIVNYLPSQNTSFLTFNLFLNSNTEILSGRDSDRILLFWGKTDDTFTRIIERSTDGGAFEIIATLPGSTDFYIDFAVEASKNYNYRYFLQKGDNNSAYSEIVTETLSNERGDFYNLVTDGTDEDWFALSPLSTQTAAAAYTLRTFWGSERVNFMLSGSSINQYAIFIDTDNNQATGGPIIPQSSSNGFDYLVRNDSLFQFTNGNWEFTQVKPTVASLDNFTEISFELTNLTNLGENQQLNISAYYNINTDTVFLPSKDTRALFVRDISSQPPTTFTVRKSGDLPKSRLVISWDKCEDCTGYMLERSLNGIEFTEIGDYTPSVTLIQDNGLSNNTTYYYRMFAYSDIGPSNYTAIVSESTGETVLAVNNIDEIKAIHIYPNPVVNNLYIDSNIEFGLARVQLFSVLGNKMADYEMNFRITEGIIPVHNLQNGVYVLIITDNKNTYRLKFIKNQ